MFAHRAVAFNIALLKRNLELNGEGERITVLEGAVSDEPGTASFHLSAHSNLGTFHASGSAEKLLSGEQISVRTYTVPELAAEYGAGSDPHGCGRPRVEVIRGMIPAIRGGVMRPTIIFETHLSRYSEDHDMAGVLTDLFECGYGVPRAASSWQDGTRRMEALGYKELRSDPHGRCGRVIFEDISNEDALDCICRTGGLRTVVLAPWTDPATPYQQNSSSRTVSAGGGIDAGSRLLQRETRRPKPRSCPVLDTDAIDPDALARAVEKVEGHFAVIARQGDLCYAIVDHCRSTPVFYTHSCVSNDAHLLRSHQKLDALDSDGVTDAAMAGFVTGRGTLVAGLHQLEAGGLAIWRGTSEPEIAPPDLHALTVPVSALQKSALVNWVWTFSTASSPAPSQPPPDDRSGYR